MSPTLGPLDIDCDAPAYPVVQASHRLGIRFAEDVRWLRIRKLLFWKGDIGKVLLDLWMRLVRRDVPTPQNCPCGRAFPRLKKATFLFDTGKTESYVLGQCPRCRTVVWDNME
jgi:hypothetical protein